jgi:hypothetical protein
MRRQSAEERSRQSFGASLPRDSRRGFPNAGTDWGGDFSELWVLKPGDYRFVGFFDERNFVVCVGAPKRTNAKQETDYHEALRYMVEYYKKPNEEKK